MTNRNVSLLMLLLFSMGSLAQLVEKEPERCLARAPQNGNPARLKEEQAAALSLNSEVVYTLPVVVHVLHMGEPLGQGTNLSKERVEAQIRILNEDFRKKEGTPGFNSHPAGGDAGIEFVLAKSTPDNQATDGIVRIDVSNGSSLPTNVTVNDNQAQYSFWNPEYYVNIWSTPDFRENQFLGYSKFPVSDLPGLSAVQTEDADGITVNAHHFGEIATTNYNLGRTATHEMGHYLGLLHVWGNEGSGVKTCADADDFCEDTPPVTTSTSGCPASGKLACDGQKAMIENYLDYSYDRCMNIFTQDQIARMRYVLETSANRNSLLTSPGLELPTSLGIASFGETSDIKFTVLAEEVLIDFSSSLPQNVSIQCFTVTGAPILSYYVARVSENQLVVRLPEARNGIFFLKLLGNNVMLTKSLVFHH